MPQSPLYDRDFYAWANEQAALLREGKLSQADIEHIAQEIESMGRTEKRELISRLTVLYCTFSSGGISRRKGLRAGNRPSRFSAVFSPIILTTTQVFGLSPLLLWRGLTN